MSEHHGLEAVDPDQRRRGGGVAAVKATRASASGAVRRSPLEPRQEPPQGAGLLPAADYQFSQDEDYDDTRVRCAPVYLAGTALDLMLVNKADAGPA